MNRSPADIPRASLLGVRFNLHAPTSAVTAILARSTAGFVCLANVHTVMVARDDAGFQRLLAQAWLVLADGMPVAWTLRRLGCPAQQVRGPSLADALCQAAAQAGIPIGLYGARPDVRDRLMTVLRQRHPSLAIVFSESPPFRELSPTEHAETALRIRASGAKLLLVGLGCPKQERWMAQQAEALPIPLIGVGAWFDFASGTQTEASPWLRAAGMEWLYRLVHEPRRLWRRYSRDNPRFCWLAAGVLVRHHVQRPGPPLLHE